MNARSQLFLEKGRRALAASQLLAGNGYAEFAVGRAYFAMFHAATVALLEVGIERRSHHGVWSAFGQHVALPGRVPTETHRWLIDAGQARATADYNAEWAGTAADADLLIERALAMLSAVELAFASPPP